jgi:hypothetical protein
VEIPPEAPCRNRKSANVGWFRAIACNPPNLTPSLTLTLPLHNGEGRGRGQFDRSSIKLHDPFLHSLL